MVFGVLVGFVIWQVSEDNQDVEVTISVAEAMGGNSTEGYLRATGPREFKFPEDHGPHPGFRTEWWYYTGNLFTENGRRFGYQFTIFRNQLKPSESAEQNSDSSSIWSSNQLYLGHVAVSDIENERHVFDERYSRGAAGLAGAQVQPYKIWLEDWTIEGMEVQSSEFPNALSAHIKAEMENGASISLKTRPLKPSVFHGDRGYDEKGPDAGNASYYISFTRLQTEGFITLDGQKFAVKGQSWMDHEWSTSALGSEQKGWDWFSIQLSNGYDLMYYQLRNKDGTLSSFSTATLVSPDGEVTAINPETVTLTVLDTWKSPENGAEYPVQWKLEVPAHNLSLNLETVFDNQEMNVSVRYYEGALSVEGKADGEEIGGVGFIEMTGYAPQ